MQRNQNKNQKQNPAKQGLEVYCRLRPVASPTHPVCMKVIPPSVVHVLAPTSTVQLRNGPPQKEIQYTFKKVFDENVNQKEVFDTVALPLVENLLKGGNGLLFTYGVTGSGKTFTMNGTGKDGGIMPRCIDTIFNSIGPYKTGKYVFKPDRLNGFEIQGEADALIERQQDFLAQLTRAKNKEARLERKDLDPDLAKRVADKTKITNILEDNTYAVFVTFVEIYNNSVFDLLDESFAEGARARTPQVKIIREDADRNMFVHGVNELEVTSAEEAFQAFYSGQKRKRIAHTALNAESSRAHTIFTIRVVQAPTDDHGGVVLDKRYMQVGQLSLVDLAGSERTNRTKNTGQRLREAGNINNSLMTLRSCLETLRENQKGANKMVPYRDSRLTHLFKSFFEGEGFVAMVVCVNPRAEDYDENLHVMKFAEMSQEVQIMCPPTPKTNYFNTPRRRRVIYEVKRDLLDEQDKENKGLSPDENWPKAFELFSGIPTVGYLSPEDDDACIPKCIKYLESQLKLFENFSSSLNQRGNSLRDRITMLEKKAFMSNQEIKTLTNLCDREKGRVADLEARIKNSDSQMTSYKRKVDEYELDVKKLKRELSEKELLINRNRIDTNKVKERFNTKIAQTEEKLKNEMERKLRSQKSALEFELRSKDRRLREAKRVLSDEALVPAGSVTPAAERIRPAAPWTPLTLRPPSPNFRSTGRKLAAGRRMRRSRSADTWLEHKPPAPSNLPTVLQPVMTKRKSVSKLTDAKDLLSGGADRYCLVTQGQDSDGDLEARIYKGDIVPTTGGGAQVMFSDVEILKQKSPTSPRRQFAAVGKNTDQACSVAVEGHGFRR